MKTGRSALLKRLVPIVVLALLGIVSFAYILVQQRFPVPFRDYYNVKAVLPAADGVAPGFGQPVNVSGVKVGTITKQRLVNRQSEVTLQIDAKKLKHVYKDAKASLTPVTPLDDMRIELVPGDPKAGTLPKDGVISPAHTTSPTQLATLLNTLDTDTRGFLATLLDGLGQGTKDRAPDIRDILLSFGPTVGQLRQVSTSLAARRRELARLVHNVSVVTKAADSDGRLADLVVSGNTTLAALAKQDAPLRDALKEFPGALNVGNQALRDTADLADELRPAVTKLTPPARRLRSTLRTLSPVAGRFGTTLEKQFRPLTTELQPVAKQLGPAVGNTSRALPDLSIIAKRTRYLLNEIAYNPPGGQEGGLYYLSWASHNFISFAGQSDAHGQILRVLLNVDCLQINAAGEIGQLFKLATGSYTVCPSTDNTGNAAATPGGRKKQAARTVSRQVADRASSLVPALPGLSSGKGR